MKKSILFLLIIINAFSINAQLQLNKEQLKNYRKCIRKGNIYFQNFDYHHAINEYNKASVIADTSFSLNYNTGIAWLYENYPDSSVLYLNKAFKISQKDSLETLFYLATAYQDAYLFDSAVVYYNKCILSGNYPDEKLLNKRITECEAGSEIIKDTLDFVVKRVSDSINSPSVDYGLYILNGDSLAVFSSKRPENIGGYKSPDDGDYYEDILFSKKEKDGFRKAYNPKRPINTEDPDACVGVSPDGKRVFIYSDVNGGDIFYTYFNGDKWEKPIYYKPVNSPYLETSLAFTKDEEYIYFTANRKKSFGGLDIFYVKKLSDSTYSVPVHLGRNINSAYDENWVYINPTNDTLYFSSKGHNSMGGYDIFRSVKNQDGEWQKAENIGYPINTPFDDMNFFPYKNKFYFSSIHKNTNTKNDIFYAYKPVRYAYLCIKVQQDDTLRELKPNILVYLDNEQNVCEAEKSNNLKKCYRLKLDKKYKVKITAENYLSVSDSILLKKDTLLSYSLTLDPAIFIKAFKIYYYTNKYKINEKFYQGLDSLISILKENPACKLEIAGHTDDVGSIKYNNKLAKKRAMEVFNYLTQKGISSERFKYTSYGSSKPVVANDTDEHRFLNRRVEFYIISK